MKSQRSTRRMGMAVLTGGLAFVGTADATELIIDGNFENTRASSNPVVKVGGTNNPSAGGGWSAFSTYLYSTLYTLPGPAGSGLQYLRPYPSGTYGITQSSQTVTQLVSLTASTSLTPAKIDGGQGRFTMSAWFSSYRTQGDYSALTLQFLDTSNNPVGEAIPLGGSEFIVNLPTDMNAKYGDAKNWGQDKKDGTVPARARTARVTIASTSASGAPDGYVDLVSLDVVDTATGTPAVGSADPPDKAVAIGPEVNISLTLQDRSTSVNTNSIKLFLDNNAVTPSIQKSGTNTVVSFAAGLLPALSPHTYSIVFADTATPAATQTNQFGFTVADYLTLPSALRGPLGSEDASKPGFNVSVYQVETLTDPDATQVNLPASIGFSESVLAGLVGPNVADRTGAQGNTFAVPGVIDWINGTGASANFPNDQPFPGIPGTAGTEESFVHEIQTFVRFPTAGFYRMGINNEDQFRLTAATAGVATLQLTSPTNLVIPTVPIATNITQLQFGGSLPGTPLTASMVYGTPTGNPDDACRLATNTSLAGKIVLLDRGATNCTSAFKAEQAQLAGAVAVIETTPGNTGFPFRLDDINTNVRIPVLVVGENYGGGRLKSYLTNGVPVTATIRADTNPRIAEWDGPKGFGAVDVTFGFAVPSPGIYPLRLVAGQEAARANLEWFSIKADGTRILVNDPANADALRAFRARTAAELPSLNRPTIAGGQVTISWTGPGTLEEATSIVGPWKPSVSQTNPQIIRPSESAKFFRVRQ
jgi:hypothetical protein